MIPGAATTIVDTMMLKLVLLTVVLLHVTNCDEISIRSQDIVTLGSGKVYYFSKTQTATMYEATNACIDAGMALVAIETESEMTDINKYILNNNLTLHDFHTSGVRVHHHWLWSSSGRLFGYSRWHPDKSCPTAHTQCCAYYFNGWIGEFNCDRTMRFICEGFPQC